MTKGPTPILRHRVTHYLVVILANTVSFSSYSAVSLFPFVCKQTEVNEFKQRENGAELQFNNSHERSHEKSAKHLSPRAILPNDLWVQTKPNFSLSIVFILKLEYFCLRCHLILSWDRLMPHFIRHTINVIIFIFPSLLRCRLADSSSFGHLVFKAFAKVEHNEWKWFTLWKVSK